MLALVLSIGWIFVKLDSLLLQHKVHYILRQFQWRYVIKNELDKLSYISGKPLPNDRVVTMIDVSVIEYSIADIDQST